MSAINDGGPAFPTHVGHITSGDQSGMSLRDYFAAHATELDLQPWLLNGYTRPQAKYRYADSMLQAKENEPR